MDLSSIQPILNEPALFIKNKKILVIADLHIGIEKEFREKGLNIPSQTQSMIDKIKEICNIYKPKDIMILGDIKHNIPSSTFQERKDVKNFLEIVENLGLVHIIPGNHDGNIKNYCSDKIKIHQSIGFIHENIGFFHGHRWPNQDIMNCDQIIFGHTHPTIMFTDRLGYNIFEPCWIRGNLVLNKVKKRYSISKNPQYLIIPTFNQFCGGVSVNKQGINGPMKKLINIDKADVHLIDGTFLGKVKDIK